ncbi:MAG: AAA family ATPase, partial [Gemmatimonadota bacterium]
GVRYLLDQAADEGHAYLPETELVVRGAELLGVDRALLPPALVALRADGGIAVEEGRHYLPGLHRAEVGVARALARLQEVEGAALAAAPLPEAGAGEVELSQGQQQAVALALGQKLMVLTGGPGTGKTTVTRAIVRSLEAGGLAVLLCSPTGRAAKRLAEATGREARTIHRLLEYLPAEGRFQRDEAQPIEADALIVDEASMIDLALMHALLRGLPPTARLVLVGDVDQLPSVGPGHVMRDIIASGRVPVARLTEIHRQGAHSQIVLNAHRVNQGAWPLAENRRDGDFFIMEVEEPEQVATTIEELCAQRLPAHGKYDPVADIQVLTPMYRGETGALSLNQRLQRRLNPSGRSHQVGERELRVGDKVMQVRNNYDKGVFNGDVGRITCLDADEETVAVSFDGGHRVEYRFGELDDLVLAYAVSIHRSQGSEFPVVVMPLTTQHYVMLQRNLLYTAITRARQLMVVVGSRRALRRAVENNQVASRHTALRERLEEGRTGALPAGVKAGGA